MPTIREAVAADAVALAPRLRDEDVAEIRAASGQQPLASLQLGIEFSSKVFAIEDKGKVQVLFGVVPIGSSKIGAVWLLGSNWIERNPVWFVRHSRKDIVGRLEGGLCRLIAYADARNTTHIRWLRWLGFNIEEAEPYGVEQHLFHFVSREIACASPLSPP